MDRHDIIGEIRRTARDGRALGKMAFERETGIKESDWSGKYWARWSDAIAEAGFDANQMNTGYEADYIIENLIAMIKHLGKWPTNPERKLYHARNPQTPSRNTYYRLGNQQAQAKAVLEYASKNEVSDDIVALCREVADKPRADGADAAAPPGGLSISSNPAGTTRSDTATTHRGGPMKCGY